MTVTRTASRKIRRRLRRALGLTLRQGAILSFTHAFSADSGGVSTTFSEIKDHHGLSWKSGISRTAGPMEAVHV